MTKDQDNTQAKSKGLRQFVAWGLLAALVVGLSGFGITNFTGGTATIGRVGEREIDAARYARALDNAISGLSQQFGTQITFAQAQQFGLDRQVLEGLVAEAALENEAARLGLSLGDAVVVERITQDPSFLGADGKFSREAYKFALSRINLSESRFEVDIRAEMARQLLTGGIVAGHRYPKSGLDQIFNFLGEERNFTLIRIDEASVTGVPDEAPEEILRAFYNENIAQFTAPESKRISYIALLPEDIADAQPIDDDQLRALYESRVDTYKTPEMRIVERLVYPNAETAQTAKAELDGGKNFEDLVIARGLTLEDIDLGDVTREDLGAAADVVFSLEDLGVVGPVDTDLGPALFRVNAILEAQNTTFDDAKEELLKEAQLAAARNIIATRAEVIDDVLAGGATLDNVATEESLTLQFVDVPVDGDNFDGLMTYGAFRDAVLAITPEDFPSVIVLDDGGIVAMRMESLVPAAPTPFESAAADVLSAWQAAEREKIVLSKAEEIKVAVEKDTALDGFEGVTTHRGVKRTDTVSDAPENLVTTLFTMAPNEARVIRAPGFAAVALLEQVLPPLENGQEADETRNVIGQQLSQLIGQDALTLATRALQKDAGIKLDQVVIDAVLANFN